MPTAAAGGHDRRRLRAPGRAGWAYRAPAVATVTADTVPGGPRHRDGG